MKLVDSRVLVVFAIAHSAMSIEADAHEVAGFIGKSALAVDLYQVRCFDDGTGATDYLAVEISDQAPVKPSLLSVQVSKDDQVRNITDLVDGDEAFSRPVKLKGGNGDYVLSVDKTGAYEEVYNLEVHCVTATGAHTGTTEPVLLQDQ
ncbi:hypothetical protein [Methylocucumis oryzae]|uniref:hypothetical protein n=1 Tax=Methylocucumis oryzae TaxID=1632867 RepID=UPI0006987F0F|nr:hypothetical protein [Methylocucumis oryzae]